MGVILGSMYVELNELTHIIVLKFSLTQLIG